MKVFGVVVVLLVVAVTLSYAMGEKSEKTYSWRYKMTVEIETPEGIKTGSAVREVTEIFIPTYNKDPRDPKYSVGQTMKGEAVVVDLGKRGIVFSLLKGPLLGVDYGATIPFYVFSGPPGRTVEGAEYYSQLKAKTVLDPTHYPMFITFTDMNDPKTIVSILEFKPNTTYPRQYSIEKNEFEKYFGKDVSLKSVIIEMTNEPVLSKIGGFIPWFGSKKIGLDFWDPQKPAPEKYLTSSDFKKGIF